MADAYIEFRGYTLELQIDEFAFFFAMLRHCANRNPERLSSSSGLTELTRDIRERNLDHDWDCVLELDVYLHNESDVAAFLELLAASVKLIRIASDSHRNISSSFYTSFEGAHFFFPFSSDTHYRAVVWPFIQVASMIMLRRDTDNLVLMMHML